MRAREESFRILEAAIGIASPGVDAAEVSLGGGYLGVTRFADNQVHPTSELSREVLSVRVSSKGRVCRVETSDLSTAGIKEAAQQARTRIEHLAPASPAFELPGPQTYTPVDAYDPATDALGPLDRAALAGRAILAGHKHGLVAAGFVALRRGSIGLDGRPGPYAIANTRGLLAYHAETRLTYSVEMARKDGAMGWGEVQSSRHDAVDADSVVAVALKKATVKGGLGGIGSGAYTAVLEPAAVAQLVRYIGLTAGASLVASGSSFLSGRLGERVAGEGVHIFDDHAHPLHHGRPFDVEGVATHKVSIIHGGVARAPVHSSESARRMGADPTGHRVAESSIGESEAATHLVFEGGEATLSDLVGGVKNGVLVTRLGSTELVDPRRLLVTGATRDGLFLIRDGEIAAPLRNMRFTLDLLELLSNVRASSDAVWAQGSVVPALKVDGFPLVSDAEP